MKSDKENKFVLTGAGFSLPLIELEQFKLSTNFLTELITKPELYNSFLLRLYNNNITKEYFEIINITKRIHENLTELFKNKKLGSTPNFEHIIYLCEILSNFTDDKTFPKKYLDIFRTNAAPDLAIAHHTFNQGLTGDNTADDYVLNFPYEFDRYYVNRVICQVSNEFKDCGLRFKHVFFLKELILDVVSLFKIPKEKEQLLEHFFESQLKNYNLKYYTLNYDSIPIEVLTKLSKKKIFNFNKDFNTGSHLASDGEINPAGIFKNILNKDKPHSLFYLHGSVYYKRMIKSFSVDFNKPRSPNLRNMHYTSMLGDQTSNNFINPDGSFRYNTSMITGMNKESKLSQEPYSSIFTNCRLDYMNSSKVLVLGYSFSDTHINSIIKNLTDKHSNYTVVDYSPKADKETNKKNTIDRRIDFVNLVEDSCIQKPTLLKNGYLSNQEYDENNCWEYQMDKCKGVMDYNGTEIALEKYAI